MDEVLFVVVNFEKRTLWFLKPGFQSCFLKSEESSPDSRKKFGSYCSAASFQGMLG